jgi:hypothetical protein
MALCAWEVFGRLAEPAAHLAEFLAMAEGLERFHAFLLRERDPQGEGLVACVHPWETGTDNSPAFEPLMERTRAYVEAQQISLAGFARADRTYVPAAHRPTDRDYVAFFGLIAHYRDCAYDQRCITQSTPFLWQDVMFNTLLVIALDALARLEGTEHMAI